MRECRAHAGGFCGHSRAGIGGRGGLLIGFELEHPKGHPANRLVGLVGVEGPREDEIAGADPGELIGFTASGWETGIFTWGLNYSMQDDLGGVAGLDATGLVLDVLIGNGYVHYESTDLEAGSVSITPSTWTLGYTQSLGRQTTMWYEWQETDADTGVSNDDTTFVRAVLKYDWK